jgi:hypothetical protein
LRHPARRRIRRRDGESSFRSKENIPMSTALNRLALAALACVIAVPASAQLIQRKDLSYAMAKTIA